MINVGKNVSKQVSELKADTTTKLSLKTDKTYTDAQLVLKANQTDLNTANTNITSNTAQIASNTNAIASIGNGSPKGVYATLTALQTAFPTGTTGIYIVTADGKWYYWNGSAWTAGAVYQSSFMDANNTNISDVGNYFNGSNAEDVLQEIGANNSSMQVDLYNVTDHGNPTNILTNSDFSNGVSGWIASNSSISVSNKKISISGDGSAINPRASQNTSIPAVVGHKVFVKAKYVINNSNATNIVINVYNSNLVGTVTTAAIQNTPVSGNEYNLFGIITVPSDWTGNLRIALQHYYASNPGAESVLNVQYVTCVDLTNNYGVGAEPDATTFNNWVSSLVNGWFGGSAHLTTRTVKQPSSLIDKANIKSTGFPFPNDLIAFWDFGESQAPYYAKAGVDKFPLTVGGTSPVSVVANPFGKGLQFNGSSDYLTISNANVGALNVGKSGDEVTVIAWIYCPSDVTGFIAGMWQEDNGNPQRQYGMFGSLPLYGGERRVCGHVSKLGGASPNLPYSRDYSTTAELIGNGSYKCVGFTYDGTYAKSYIDGITDSRPVYTEPTSPNGEGLTYAKNPYTFDLGLNQKSLADFTVGSCKLTSGWGNFFNGILCGLAVFGRALTQKEMLKIHINSLNSDLLRYYDFNMIGTGNGYAGDYGWVVAAGASAVDYSLTYTDWNLAKINTGSKSFIFRPSNNPSNASPGIFTTTGFSNVRLGQISKIEFLMNNKLAGDSVRLCLKVGNNWYATATQYDSGAVGVSGADWTTAVLKSFTPTRDKTQWLQLQYVLGTSLSLGTQPASNLPNEEVTAIGFYSSAVQTNGILRISDLKIHI